jgi:hypothetical protein
MNHVVGAKDSREFAILDKEARTFAFRFREGFGDGRDADGLLLANPEAELEEARKVFNQSIDMMLGRRRSIVPVERWVQMRCAALPEGNQL